MLELSNTIKSPAMAYNSVAGRFNGLGGQNNSAAAGYEVRDTVSLGSSNEGMNFPTAVRMRAFVNGNASSNAGSPGDAGALNGVQSAVGTRPKEDVGAMKQRLASLESKFRVMEWFCDVSDKRAKGWKGEVPGPREIRPGEQYKIDPKALQEWKNGGRERTLQEINELRAKISKAEGAKGPVVDRRA